MSAALALQHAEAEMLRALANHPELALPNSTTQRGEQQPAEQCEQVLRAALAEDVCGFLRRHGRLLRYGDLALFDGRPAVGPSGGAVLAEVLADLRLRLSPAKERKGATVRNRRFNYLARQLTTTDYFSVEMMTARRPDLYAQYTRGDKEPAGDGHSASSMCDDDDDDAVVRAEAEAAQVKKLRSEFSAPSSVQSRDSAPPALWGALPAAGQSVQAGVGAGESQSGGGGAGGGMWGEFAPSSAAEDATHSRKLREELTDSFAERGLAEQQRQQRQQQLCGGPGGGGGNTCGQIIADIQHSASSASGSHSAAASRAGGSSASATGAGSGGPFGEAAETESHRPDEESATYQLSEFTDTMKRMWLNGEDEAFFDYDVVDLNAANDDWQQQQRDEEDDYFNGNDDDDDGDEGDDDDDDDDGFGDDDDEMGGRRSARASSEGGRKRERDALRARALAALAS